jgi:flavin reductase (DIM6/NTAB) family NADH-FMN oxidoreductase RutF
MKQIGRFLNLKPNPINNPKFYTTATSNRLNHTANKMAAEKTAAWEKSIQRNPHPDFKKVEASRPPFNPSTTLTYTQTPDPNWQFGTGANSTTPPSDTTTTTTKNHISIDPYAPDRPPGFNYKLLISAIIPRPIAFLSTRSADGTTTNLAPFSYFQMIGHDPPLFIIGFASALEAGRAKDSLRNLHERGECVINMISEGFVEAANSTSINAPYGVSEWDVSGLTPVYDCETVGCARVKEAVFAVEGRLESVREFESRVTPGKVTSTLAVIEGTRFWAREDAVNEERNIIDAKVSLMSGV